jgi:hypothetical protein
MPPSSTSRGGAACPFRPSRNREPSGTSWRSSGIIDLARLCCTVASLLQGDACCLSSKLSHIALRRSPVPVGTGESHCCKLFFIFCINRDIGFSTGADFSSTIFLAFGFFAGFSSSGRGSATACGCRGRRSQISDFGRVLKYRSLRRR